MMKRIVYGVDLEAPDYNTITHILVLTEEEAQTVVDLEDLLDRFGDRLLAVRPEEAGAGG